MLRIHQNMSAASAKSYYSQADYYSEGQELIGQWGGKGAELLGLSGVVDSQAFGLLCDNQHPFTREQLTLRNNAERTVGYDFNFHAPKSVSLLYELSRDENILTAFRQSVQETMQEIETEAKTRIRKHGEVNERTTGNLIWSEFIHFTARPVDGVPDPLLHAHVFTFNATFDPVEQVWKAGQFRDLKRDAPYYEAVFHARFSSALAAQGYAIDRTPQRWELAGLTPETLKRFSRRTEQIEELARQKGVTDPNQKAELGAKTRQVKGKELTREELRAEWWSRLTDQEAQSIAIVAQQRANITLPALNTDQSIRHAIQHVFERDAVVPAKCLVREALRQGVGQVDVKQVWQQLPEHGVILKERDGRLLATTREVLAEEQQMLDFARQGRGTQKPLNPDWTIQRDWLNAGQQAAVNHVLTAKDRVILIQGKAGVGKTTLLQEVRAGLAAAGIELVALAPSAIASRGVLREEGFASADTVARFLVDPELQESARYQVLLIDEAGLLGSRTLAQVFEKARQLNARTLLSGDWQQHGSVERGAPLRLLVEEGGLQPAKVDEIQRQRGSYKEVVQHLSAGRTLTAMDGLEQLGWFEQWPDGLREQRIAEEYLSAIQAQKSVLVVAPTHKEGDLVTQAIRCQLQQAGKLSEEEITSSKLTPLHLTEAERTDPLSYRPGDVLQFVKPAKGHRSGERIVFNPNHPPELSQIADRIQVYRQETIPLAVGETIRITANGKTADGKHRLNNGSTYQITDIAPDKSLTLNNGWTISPEYGHLTHGYVSTSHASQGKTVDRVLIAQSTQSYGASSQQQAYVSISRGREMARLFTDDKPQLRNMLRREENKLSATSLVQPVRTADWWKQMRTRWLIRMTTYQQTWQRQLQKTLQGPQQTNEHAR